jgi:hypothetical protein
VIVEWLDWAMIILVKSAGVLWLVGQVRATAKEALRHD